ncbi:MAG: ATP-binding cassette domain-containing protein, partial [Candidatus Hydrogenedentes bacterium]|nr:ATP-binding cassette domain-containing protein [Candidatus Hydrogenedentota bacterium]
FRYFMKIAVADEMVKPLMEVIGVVGVVCFFVVGARQVLDGTMESSAFLLFNGALISCYEPVKKLSKVFTKIQKGVTSGQRVFEVIDSDEIERERPDAVELAPFNDTIRFENVSFRYGDGDAVLSDVNLEIRRGEIVAIVGASGAGKTTLVNLVPRFYDVTDGCVRIDGLDVRDVTLFSLRKQIAVVSQDVVLFNDTVRNNIAYGRADCDDELIVSASRAADADAFVRELPNGYDTVLAERGQSLSGGQKQRLAIARAIAKDPAILILDEATSSLDSESERAIQDALDRFIQGRTTLVIAHRLSTVLNADKIVVVDAGRVVGIGKHSELLDTNPVYRRLYEAQFRNGAGGTGQC